MSATTLQRPSTPTLTDQDIQVSLSTGLRNRWYPILPSRMIEPVGKPLGLIRLGEKLVVWRDSAGTIHVQTDRCPHRAVALSRGMNEGDRLRCAYHGVEVGPDGTVLAVPGQPGCALEGKKAVKTYPAQEIAGAIFVWFGDALHADPTPFSPPEQLASNEYSSFCCYADWNASWRYVYDNLMDPMHGTFLHANSHTMFQGETQAVFVTRDTPTGFFFEKSSQRDVNFDWSEFVDDGLLFVRLEIPYPKSGGPGGNFGIVSFITPIDETNSACFFWRIRKVSGWQRDTWRFLYKTKLEPRHWHVLEQDRELMDGCGLGLEKHEMLYQHDAGLIRLRRYLAQQARAQLTELRNAGKA
jgi:phenylpropionate dioxygenase-like ring-hydroxylating dioxygenase large terminal subunit